jgi:hypothetical protein
VGFLDRVAKGLGGLVDVAEAPVQYGWDIARTFYDDDFRRDGFVATLWGSSIDRFGQAASGLWGEQGFGGQLTGAIPEPVRRPWSDFLGLGPGDGSLDNPGYGLEEAFGGGVLGFLESAGREFIREPLTTAVTAASLNDRPGGGAPIIGLFDANKWKRGHEIAQSRSLGQAITLAVMTKDVLDEDELIKAQASPWFPIISGGWDAAARIFLDTDTVIGGFAIEGVRASRSQRLRIAAEREVDALRIQARHGQARNRALGLLDEPDDAARATEALTGRNRLKVTRTPVADTVDDWADPMLTDTGLDGRAGDIITAALGEGHGLERVAYEALQGNTMGLKNWATAHGVKLSQTEVAKYIENPTDGAHSLALKVAEAKGFNNVDIVDGAGQLADSFDLGNFDMSLERSVDKARKKYGAGTYNETLSNAEFVRARFDALRAGGWDKLLELDQRRVDKMSSNLKYAREHFLRSPQWNRKLLPWMEDLEDTALAQRIEIIRDRLFHNSADGDNLATWFALARSNSERTVLMRFAMGDIRAISEIADAGMRRDIERLAKRRFIVRHFPDEGVMHSTVEEFELLNHVDDLGANPKFNQLVEGFDRPDSLGDSAAVIADIEYYIRGGDSPQQVAYREKVAARVAEEADLTDRATLGAIDDALAHPDGVQWVKTDELYDRVGQGNDISPDDAAAYAEEMRAGNWDWDGNPLEVRYDPETGGVEIGNGNHRIEAAREAGVEWVPIRIEGVPGGAARSSPRIEAGLDAPRAEDLGVTLRPDDLDVDRMLDDFEARKLSETGAGDLDSVPPRPLGSPDPSVSDATVELQRLMQIATQDKHIMRMTARGAIREQIHTNQIVEKVWYSKHNKMRVVFDMVAQPFLVPTDPMIAGKLKRHLRDAGFSDGEQMEWLGKFAAVRYDDARRTELLSDLSNAAMAKLAEKHGVDMDVARAVAEKVAEAQSAASKLLSKNVRYGGYDAKTGKQFSRFEVVDITGDTTHMFLPLTPEQLANAHIMPNYREIDKALKRVSGWAQYGYKGMDALLKVPTAVAESINKAWKPAVLLRPAWPMRVVFDEQIRMMSVMGVMERLATLRASGRELKMNLLRDMFGKVDKDRNVLFLSVGEDGRMLPASPYNAAGKMAKPMADPRKAARGMGLVGAGVGLALGGGPGAVAGAMIGGRFGHKNAQLANGLQLLNLSSTKNLAFDGYRFMADMGNPGDVANVYRDEISAGRQLDSILARSQVEEINRLRFDPRRWKNYFPADPGYEEMWQLVVNHQFGNSTLSRMLWNDALDDDFIVDWLTQSSEGRKTLRAMPTPRRENPEEWIGEARRFMHQNLLPGEAMAPLRERLVNGGSINFSEVKRLDPEWQNHLGSVHGMEVIQITDRGSEMIRFFRKKVERAMEHLGKTPTDTLSRQPFFAHQYREQIQRSVALLKDEGGTYRLSQKELRAMEDQARRVALKKTRTLLYDLAEESQFAQAVRFIMPFFNAWQEVITRYAGIAIDNPLYASRLVKAYNSLDNVGTSYTDDYGNTVQRIRLPSWAKGLVNVGIFRSAIDDQGYIAFNKKQLSMLGEAMPGFGPIANVMVSQVARDRPELEEALGFMFPYGLAAPGEEGLIEQFLPTAARHLVTGFTENDAFQSTRARIALNMITQAEVSGQPLDLSDPAKVKDFYAEVTRQTKAFYSLRTVAAMTLPLAPQWQSPYQDYIQEWQKLRLEDPENAEQRFLEQYGEEYFALTQSLTKTYDGVPATIVGEQVRDKYAELVEAYPEFGSLIIGSEGGGTGVRFSRAIYDKQRHEPISQGNPQTRRGRLPLEEVITSPDARLGWQKWRQFSDWKIEQMDRLGIRSLSQRGGEALSLVQRTMVEQLARAHPEWYEEFVDRDEAKWLRRIDAFEAISTTSHEGLRNRPDIAGLREYLAIRRRVESELVRRREQGGSANLQANANRDLQLAWDILQNDLKERRPMFADLHARWLEGDLIHQNTFRTTVG